MKLFNFNFKRLLPNSKKEAHKKFLIDNIFLLHKEILEDVLSYNRTGILPIKSLKHKAGLVYKYSRRLRLINM
tara:strand:- start:1818 stop:2036 length:219 start_codon:yes stop_codon:yes gene_type:complete